MKDRYQTIIIGAGPAGMAAAMELSKAKKEFGLVEKADRVGGLSKTYTVQEGELIFRTDNGPHRFFSKNPYLYRFIEDLIQDDWIQVRRQTRQYIAGTFLDYPINPSQVIRALGWKMIFKAGWDYLKAVVTYQWLRRPVKNFYEYAISQFGRTLAMFNMINYTEKIWGISTTDLHVDWAKQRITGLNFGSLLKNVVTKWFSSSSSVKVKSLTDVFYYPRHGTGEIYQAIEKRLRANGYDIAVNTQPTKIRHDGKHILSIDLESQGQIQTLTCENLVESIHLTDFVTLLDPLPPPEVLEAARRLRYRSQIHLFVTLNKPSITPDQWIYFPEQKIPFARVSEMRNFSADMSPPGKTSWFIEFFCDETDPVYAMSKQELFALALPSIEACGFFTAADVRETYLFRGQKDYPIYDTHYEENLARVKEYMDRFENLYYIGRPGRFKYTNQDHSLEMGILAARSIIEGRRYDIEAVGSEKEYFEQGQVPVKTS
ncbi:FAD-dependent oxidoreductase [Patescibacteria group bacterium]|nr:FAD-dependent oxidoreductase [Patescibacteria group bacterium]MBP9709718.1 FAD-dependent oxidoreductase [Patescibacteria group bacterium]